MNRTLLSRIQLCTDSIGCLQWRVMRAWVRYWISWCFIATVYIIHTIIIWAIWSPQHNSPHLHGNGKHRWLNMDRWSKSFRARVKYSITGDRRLYAICVLISDMNQDSRIECCDQRSYQTSKEILSKTLIWNSFQDSGSSIWAVVEFIK